MLVTWDQDGTRQTGQRLILKPDTTSLPHVFPGSGKLSPIQVSASYSGAQAGETRFRIASNTGFKIRAQLVSESGPVHAPLYLEIIGSGPKAMRPNLTKQGENLFQVANKTAAFAGDPIDQSVEFKAIWDKTVAADLVLVLTAN
ncbi:MAG: hypothetical protein Hens3KO_10530 [Henriciella sp.]